MGENEHERLLNITLRHKFKWRISAFIAVMHFTVIVRSLKMDKIHILKMHMF